MLLDKYSVMPNIVEVENFSARLVRTYREKQIEWLDGLGFNVGLTLNFNDNDVSLWAARKIVGECFGRIDRALLGRNFNKKSSLRTHGVFFFEHITSNIHCHGLVRIEAEKLPRFMGLFPAEGRGGVWSDVWVSGTHFVRDIVPRAAAAYVTKEQTPWSDPQTTLWLSEFHPA